MVELNNLSLAYGASDLPFVLPAAQIIGSHQAAVKQPSNAKERLDPEIGMVRRCSKCGDWWPANREFFYSSGSGGRKLHSWCIACYTEWRSERRSRYAHT